MFDVKKIFGLASRADFDTAALELFRLQAVRCAPYAQFLGLLGVDPLSVGRVEEIPFLPVEFFKSHRIYCGDTPPETAFTSSGTTGALPGTHFVASLSLYEESFTRCFSQFYGDPSQITIFALLPGYLERSTSSLVYMADRLIKKSGRGGFFLDNMGGLAEAMERSASRGEKILLLGVSFALWEMAENYRLSIPGLTVMETGGMKGRRREITRQELHSILTEGFGVESIHSEYGMTEMLSQGYSSGRGVYTPPGWMRVMVRDVNDPTDYLPEGARGGINVIDLANVYSCSFLQTMDIGVSLPGGEFVVEGRITGSDIRGCNLMYSGNEAN